MRVNDSLHQETAIWIAEVQSKGYKRHWLALSYCLTTVTATQRMFKGNSELIKCKEYKHDFPKFLHLYTQNIPGISLL